MKASVRPSPCFILPNEAASNAAGEFERERSGPVSGAASRGRGDVARGRLLEARRVDDAGWLLCGVLFRGRRSPVRPTAMRSADNLLPDFVHLRNRARAGSGTALKAPARRVRFIREGDFQTSKRPHLRRRRTAN